MRVPTHHHNPNTVLDLQQFLDESVDFAGYLVKLRTSASRDVIYHLLQQCIKRKDLIAGRHAYSFMINVGFDSIPVLLDHLIRLFAACGSQVDANDVFSKMSRPSVYTWNAMISAHANLDDHAKALVLYHQMWHKKILPDRYTFLSILKASETLVRSNSYIVTLDFRTFKWML